MSKALIAVQTALLAAFAADPELEAEIGEGSIFDSPPRGQAPPYLVIARHDVLPRDADLAPGLDHRILLHAWAADASRALAMAIGERVVETALTAAIEPNGFVITHRRLDRLDTAIDARTGRARADIAIRLYAEPSEDLP